MKIKLMLLISLAFGITVHPQQNFWEATNGPVGAFVQEMIIKNNGYIFISTTTPNGVYRSTNGGISWVLKTQGIVNLPISAFCIDSAGNIYCADGNFNYTRFYQSTDNGNNWNVTYGATGIGGVEDLLFNDNGYLYAATYYRFWRSTDEGTTWTAINNGIPSAVAGVSLLDNSNGYIFAGTYGDLGGIFRTQDFGDNWELIGLLGKHIVDITRDNLGNIYALTKNGGSQTTIYRSTNNGDVWTQINWSIDKYLNDLTTNNINDLFASGSQPNRGVFRSKDFGNTWNSISTGLPDDNINKLALNPLQYIFAGTMQNGVYRSIESTVPPLPTILVSPPNNSNGISINPTFIWQKSIIATKYQLQISMDSLFTNVVYDNATITDTTKYLNDFTLEGETKYYWRVAAGNINGWSDWTSVWNFITEPTTSIHYLKVNLFEFTLYQNSPNPFNPTTKISFSIPDKNNVSLKIFDVLGKVVEELVNNEMLAGSYDIEFNASKLPSGVYFYRLQAGSYVETKKMVLMK